MVHKVDGNPQLDTCDWSMYLNILKVVRNKTLKISIIDNFFLSVDGNETLYSYTTWEYMAKIEIKLL